MSDASLGEPLPQAEANGKPLVQIRGVSKKFASFTAVDHIDLDIYRGELFCLLGGSGCGKTTLLRMLAGFETPTQGSITIDGEDMSRVPPYERQTNMMFQSYALFPHMTVEKNIAFGLEQDKIPKSERDERVHQILKLVELQDFKKRKPTQLSGGQCQRVALARALVKEPKLLLLDEPLGALDKRLRKQTQFELANIQEQVGITFVVVTHDQEEAMTLSSRIAVMDKGKLVQVGTPTDIYEFPQTRFVADFIGSANIFEGRVLDDRGDYARIATDLGEIAVVHAPVLTAGGKAWFALRPEKISLSREAPETDTPNILQGKVDDVGYLGNFSIYKIRLENGHIVDVTAPNLIRPKTHARSIEWEDDIYIHWTPSSAMLLNS